MANNLTFNQIATVMTQLQILATGVVDIIAPVDTASFVAAATTTLKTGYEQVYRAISAVLGRTIFSIRPYYSKLRGMMIPDTAFKLHTRKLQMIDNNFDDNAAVAWPVHYNSEADPAYGDGESVDMQAIKKTYPVQTNFYGMNTYADSYTVFDEQLEIAFRDPEEFAMFWTMVTQNIADRLEQSRENCARAILCNMIGTCAKLYEDEDNLTSVVYLLDEYNERTGLELTAETVYAPENYPDFVRWAYGRIAEVSAKMTERSLLYQTVLESGPILHHTPKERQRLYIYAPEEMQMRANVLSTTFNQQFLTLGDHETVNFWQSILSPAKVDVIPGYIGTDGSAVVSDTGVEVDNVFGVLMDEEAGGYASIRSSIKPAPYNAAGDYQNFWIKEYNKMYMDNTEKIVVFLLTAENGGGGGGGI